MEIYVTFTKVNLCSAFRQKQGGQKVLLAFSSSQLPSAQNNPSVKWCILGWYIMIPISILAGMTVTPCYEIHVCAPPPHLYIETLSCKMMALASGDLGRWFGLDEVIKVGILISGIRAFMRVTRELCFLFFLFTTWGYNKK